MYESACISNVRDKYWTGTYYTISNYNGRNQTPLFNVNIIEMIVKFTREDLLGKINSLLIRAFQ